MARSVAGADERPAHVSPVAPEHWPASACHLKHRPNLVTRRESAKKNDCGNSKRLKDPFNMKVRCHPDQDLVQEAKKAPQLSKEDGTAQTLDTDMLALLWVEDQ